MWDWIKALFDGGLTLFFFAAFIAAVLTWAHEHVRPYAPSWESALVLAGWLVVLGIYHCGTSSTRQMYGIASCQVSNLPPSPTTRCYGWTCGA